jgi:hypothetical protein
VTGARRMISTHADDRIPNLWRQTFDPLRIPGLVAANRSAARECDRLIAKRKQSDAGSDCQMSHVKSLHASTRPRGKV